jgi:hypothetical protein
MCCYGAPRCSATSEASFYRQLMYYVAIKATLASLKGIAVGWNKVELQSYG